MESKPDSANVRFPPPLLYLGALLLSLFVEWLLGIRGAGPWRLAGLGFPTTLRVPGGLIVGAMGVALMIAGAGLFVKLGTNVRPDRPSSRLVTSGIYRFTRNPMYLGMSLFYLGLALLFDSIIAIVLLPVIIVIIRTQVIAREERYLDVKFGADYRAYKTRVRRWL